MDLSNNCVKCSKILVKMDHSIIREDYCTCSDESLTDDFVKVEYPEADNTPMKNSIYSDNDIESLLLNAEQEIVESNNEQIAKKTGEKPEKLTETDETINVLSNQLSKNVAIKDDSKRTIQESEKFKKRDLMVESIMVLDNQSFNWDEYVASHNNSTPNANNFKSVQESAAKPEKIDCMAQSILVLDNQSFSCDENAAANNIAMENLSNSRCSQTDPLETSESEKQTVNQSTQTSTMDKNRRSRPEKKVCFSTPTKTNMGNQNVAKTSEKKPSELATSSGYNNRDILCFSSPHGLQFFDRDMLKKCFSSNKLATSSKKSSEEITEIGNEDLTKFNEKCCNVKEQIGSPVKPNEKKAEYDRNKNGDQFLASSSKQIVSHSNKLTSKLAIPVKQNKEMVKKDNNEENVQFAGTIKKILPSKALSPNKSSKKKVNKDNKKGNVQIPGAIDDSLLRNHPLFANLAKEADEEVNQLFGKKLSEMAVFAPETKKKTADKDCNEEKAQLSSASGQVLLNKNLSPTKPKKEKTKKGDNEENVKFSGSNKQVLPYKATSPTKSNKKKVEKDNKEENVKFMGVIDDPLLKNQPLSPNFDREKNDALDLQFVKKKVAEVATFFPETKKKMDDKGNNKEKAQISGESGLVLLNKSSSPTKSKKEKAKKEENEENVQFLGISKQVLPYKATSPTKSSKKNMEKETNKEKVRFLGATDDPLLRNQPLSLNFDTENDDALDLEFVKKKVAEVATFFPEIKKKMTDKDCNKEKAQISGSNSQVSPHKSSSPTKSKKEKIKKLENETGCSKTWSPTKSNKKKTEKDNNDKSVEFSGANFANDDAFDLQLVKKKVSEIAALSQIKKNMTEKNCNKGEANFSSVSTQNLPIKNLMPEKFNNEKSNHEVNAQFSGASGQVLPSASNQPSPKKSSSPTKNKKSKKDNNKENVQGLSDTSISPKKSSSKKSREKKTENFQNCDKYVPGPDSPEIFDQLSPSSRNVYIADDGTSRLHQSTDESYAFFPFDSTQFPNCTPRELFQHLFNSIPDEFEHGVDKHFAVRAENLHRQLGISREQLIADILSNPADSDTHRMRIFKDRLFYFLAPTRFEDVCIERWTREQEEQEQSMNRYNNVLPQPEMFHMEIGDPEEQLIETAQENNAANCLLESETKLNGQNDADANPTIDASSNEIVQQDESLGNCSNRVETSDGSGTSNDQNPHGSRIRAELRCAKKGNGKGCACVEDDI